MKFYCFKNQGLLYAPPTPETEDKFSEIGTLGWLIAKRFGVDKKISIKAINWNDHITMSIQCSFPSRQLCYHKRYYFV